MSDFNAGLQPMCAPGNYASQASDVDDIQSSAPPDEPEVAAPWPADEAQKPPSPSPTFTSKFGTGWSALATGGLALVAQSGKEVVSAAADTAATAFKGAAAATVAAAETPAGAATLRGLSVLLRVGARYSPLGLVFLAGDTPAEEKKAEPAGLPLPQRDLPPVVGFPDVNGVMPAPQGFIRPGEPGQGFVAAPRTREDEGRPVASADTPPQEPQSTQPTTEAETERVLAEFETDPEGLDLAIAQGDPRLAGTRFEDPIAKNPVLQRIVVDVINSENHREADNLQVPDELQLELLDALRLHGAELAGRLDTAPSNAARVEAIQAALPEIQAHLDAVNDAGLTNAAQLAIEGLAKLKQYLRFTQQAELSPTQEVTPAEPASKPGQPGSAESTGEESTTAALPAAVPLGAAPSTGEVGRLQRTMRDATDPLLQEWAARTLLRHPIVQVRAEIATLQKKIATEPDPLLQEAQIRSLLRWMTEEERLLGD